MLEFSLLCLQRLDMGKMMDIIHPHVNSIHLDIMDGKFVLPTAFSSDFINNFETQLPKHVHVMSIDSEKYLNELENITSFSFHIESSKAPMDLINMVKAKGFEAGLVINPETSVKSVAEFFPNLNRVVLMAVNPGYSAQGYIPSTSKKVAQIRDISKDIEIVIDGGMHEDTIREVMTLGADSCVVCSVIVKAEDPIEKIRSLKESGSIGVDHHHYIFNERKGYK